MIRLLKILFGILIPLISGGMIYIIYRSESLLMFSWFNKLSINPLIEMLRSYNNFLLPKWVVYSLPNGLWAFSLLNGIILIWNDISNKHFLFWLLLIVFLLIMSELGQFFGLIQGTFDKTDFIIILTVIFVTVSNLLLKSWKKRRYYLSTLEL